MKSSNKYNSPKARKTNNFFISDSIQEEKSQLNLEIKPKLVPEQGKEINQILDDHKNNRNILKSKIENSQNELAKLE